MGWEAPARALIRSAVDDDQGALADLAQSVSLGYYRGILNALADIERQHPEHAAFVLHMRQLAQQFQFDAMGQILEQEASP